MTRLTIFTDKDGYIGFLCEGHSGYSEEGSDIVCAAVSTAVELVADYLLKFFPDDIKFNVDEKTARIELRCCKRFCEADRQISILADFAESLQNQYSEYFTFDYLEV